MQIGLLTKPLDELDINIRHAHILANNGFRTVGDLVGEVSAQWPGLGLRMIQGIGPKAAKEIADVIAEEITCALRGTLFDRPK